MFRPLAHGFHRADKDQAFHARGAGMIQKCLRALERDPPMRAIFQFVRAVFGVGVTREVKYGIYSVAHARQRAGLGKTSVSKLDLIRSPPGIA